MKIVKVEDLHCDAGWRVNSFLKITTDEGIVGWSEYMEGYGAQGLTGVILKLAERHLIGQDPRPVERHSAHLYAATRQAAGGVNQMVIAAIENALVDIKARAFSCAISILDFGFLCCSSPRATAFLHNRVNPGS